MDEIKVLLQAVLKNQELANAKITAMQDESITFQKEMNHFRNEMNVFKNEMNDFRNETNAKFEEVNTRFNHVDAELRRIHNSEIGAAYQLNEAFGRIAKLEGHVYNQHQ
ncbi:hypothetical protein [Paenibacillus sp. YN15]|uniref:hypothetical protein n=1 Tax=Paenibacillus sp. YN15 TaxID=1742774 RepID=UPI000DCD448C|nr:hypothetical protein [Paenibacillus sp. YN15]RAU97628.1 hypothetical protein DQG13_18590 [Paenibacillus sp. YN15]